MEYNRKRIIGWGLLDDFNSRIYNLKYFKTIDKQIAINHKL